MVKILASGTDNEKQQPEVASGTACIKLMSGIYLLFIYSS